MSTSSKQHLLKNINQYFNKIVAAQDIPPTNIDTIITGVNAVVVKYFDRGKVYAFKIPSNKELIPEIYFLKRLEETRIKAPKVIKFDLSEKIIPFPYLITNWIDGAESFKNEKKVTIVKGASVYAQELAKIHRLNVEGFGYPRNVDGQKWSCKSWQEALESFLKRNIKAISIMRKIFKKHALNLVAALTWKNKKLEIKTPKLLHGDIPNGLMKIHPKIIFLGFIDPNSPIGGDPMYDLSSVYVPNREGKIDKLFIKGFLEGYQKVNKLSEHEKYRFNHLRLFHLFWKTCFFYEHQWNYKPLYQETLKWLGKIKTK